MPMTSKANEAGWFYHAPAKKKTNPVKFDAPAPSQIPGIGFDDPTILEKEEVRPVMFKETDSKYIQLAKMGGRKDLLSFNPERFKKKQDGPVGYHRNEWFYLEDNRVEDEEKKQEESWDFLLPEYMVHKGYQPSFEDPSTPPLRTGAPYHTEKVSVLQREGRSATDKTVKIPEVRRPGFGVRNEKPPAPIKSLPRDKVVHAEDPNKRRGRQNQLNMPSENEEPTLMSKLLSGGYEKDWYDKRAEVTSKEEESKAQKKQARVSSAGKQGCKETAVATPAKKSAAEEKVLFKLSKFKNVPSKIEMFPHQSMHPVTASK